ncbi:fungal-specific transcription factor domain-containing protein [Pseudomassariella vexata]|uniref:Fungal-specific transcription factor domain-domain-containing protein n=1 Tax=Pseudomassariella vexata TaxID=1141098 RepID=A0A1Y2EG70_9PEZI|nr:fungal-specific transcription factor domain-containing protein [Pseudomassariella vexata]ORY70304.1 fungal-specific transcription factor domain-domain-containing protein [Pseudomassariella vexata]
MDNVLRPLQPVEGANKVQKLATGGGPVGPSNQRRTCLQCRVRKVRCDGRQDVCRNCERLKFECSFQQTPEKSSGQYVHKLPERRRRMQACLSCRSAKMKCLGEMPECSNCVRKGLVCSYPGSKKGEPGSSTSGDSIHGQDHVTSPRERDSGLSDADRPRDDVPLDHDTLIKLVKDYFRHLYPLPSYAFLHQTTVTERCHDRTINQPLKLAICAITALQLQRTTLSHDLWVQQAEQMILRQLGHPSIFHLQALLLVIRYRIESGSFSNAFMLAALAGRSAVALRLNYERSELSPLAQEARRRLFWSLFLLDDFFCVGIREFELCPRETIRLQLPCDEELFEAGQPCRTGSLHQHPLEVPATIGLRGAFLRLVAIRREIMRFIRRVGLREIEPSFISDTIHVFEQQLKSLYSGLGHTELYSVSNLTTCKLQTQFVMLHASWRQCFCDLYRLFLNGYTEAAPPPVFAIVQPRNRDVMQRQCVEHAEDILQIVEDLWNYGDRNALLERDTAVCGFESARIILFVAGDGASNAAATELATMKAQLCLDLMTHYFASSAWATPMRNNLERIIRDCSARLAQHKEVATEPAPPDPPPSSKISQYANSRQKLSVHSLLLQSNFVDDSEEITLPPLRYTREPQEGYGDLVNKAGSWADSRVMNLPSLMGNRNPETASGPIANAVTYDEDDGYSSSGPAFNPWMGFPGKDDVYGVCGLSGDLNEDF